MKSFINCLFLVLLTTAISCEKNQGNNTATPPPPPPTPPAPINTAPFVNAGPDEMARLSCNKFQLKGFAFDSTGVITTISWTQHSGPGQATIVTGNAISTLVTNITSGVYKFVLKVTDNTGLSSSDTAEISFDPHLTEVKFPEVTWSFLPNDILYDELRLTLPSRPDLFCDTTQVKEVAIQFPNTTVWVPLTKNYVDNFFYEIFWGSDLRIFCHNNTLIGSKAFVRVRFY